MSKLDPEELEILEAFETGKLRRSPDIAKELADHKQVAEATFKKDSRLNNHQLKLVGLCCGLKVRIRVA